MKLIEIRLSECLEKFMKQCIKTQSWKTYNEQNLVQTKTGYHKFVIVDRPQLWDFKNAIRNPTTIIHDVYGYRTVKNNFTALISFEPVSAGLLLWFEEDPRLSNQIALYDLGSAIKNPISFSKINQTNSEVFFEFEKFLSEVYQIKLPAFRIFANPINQLQILDSRSTPNGALVPKESLLKRLSKVRLPSLMSHKISSVSSREMDQNEPFEYQNIYYRPENNCCICIATVTARTRSILT
jgi:hypothetical protein